jgi:hypothetical protein
LTKSRDPLSAFLAAHDPAARIDDRRMARVMSSILGQLTADNPEADRNRQIHHRAPPGSSPWHGIKPNSMGKAIRMPAMPVRPTMTAWMALPVAAAVILGAVAGLFGPLAPHHAAQPPKLVALILPTPLQSLGIMD